MMFNLDDIKEITEEQFKTFLEKYCPKVTEKDESSNEKRPVRGSQEVNLGHLDLDKYLSQFGIAFNKKLRGSSLWFRLNNCLFDPSHKKNHSAVVIEPDGKVWYHCSHSHCNHKWEEAKFKISGDKKLTEFMTGYDSNWRPPEKKKKSNKKKEKSTKSSIFDAAAPPPDLPIPEDIPPIWFFEEGTFNPFFLATYLKWYLNNLIYVGMNFYFYFEKLGIWKVMDKNEIGQMAQKAMGRQTRNNRITDTLQILMREVFMRDEDFMHNPRYVNLKNGMIDIEEFDLQRLLPHNPKYYSRMQLNAKLDLNSHAPRWEKWLSEVFPEDKEKIKTLQSYYGYCLLPDCRYQRCLFLVGAGGNGKSVALNVLTGVLGKENVCSLPLQLMGERFLIGQLMNKLVNLSSELDNSKPTATTNFKNAVSGDLITADEKHGKPFTFYPVAKHIFSMNEIPKITDKSYGFQRRPIVLTFNERFEGDKKDDQITDKLLEERDGILLWMLEGLIMCLERNDVYIGESVARDTEIFIKSINPVLIYVEENCVIHENATIRPPVLYEDYKIWCEEGKNRPLSRNRFYEQILIHFPTVTKKRTTEERTYQGIGLKAMNPIEHG